MTPPATLPASTPSTDTASQPAAPERAAPFDAMRFADSHRILVQNLSLVESANPLLTVHPTELAPANEAMLAKKIRHVFKQNEPSCFASAPLGPVSQALSGAIPSSIEADGAKVIETVQKLVHKQASGVDPAVESQRKSEEKPFAELIAARGAESNPDPLSLEQMKNGLALTLLLECAVGEKYPQGLQGLLSSVPWNARAEQVLAAVEPVLGLSSTDLLKAARDGGIAKFGEALKVDPAYVDEVQRLTARLAEHRFSDNALQNWRVGREQPGMTHAGIEEKMAAGIDPRIAATIGQMRALRNGKFEVPPEITAMERHVASALRLIPPELAESLFRLKTDVVYTPNSSLPSAPGTTMLGFHRPIHLHADDVKGVYHLYLANGQGADDLARVAVHEAHHLQFPNQLTPTDIARVDALAAADAVRLKTLKSVLDVWSSGTPEQKATAERQLDQQFAVNGQPISTLIGQEGLKTMAVMVSEASDRLDPNSRYYRAGPYGDQSSRFNELISRYAELRFVRLNQQPDVLKFIAPGLTEAYDEVYLPHIRRGLEELRQRDAAHAAQHPEHAHEHPVAVPATLATPTPLAAASSGQHADLPRTKIDPSTTAYAPVAIVSGVAAPGVML